MTRGDMIEQLIESTLYHADMCPDYWNYVLSDGFKGFSNFTDAELIEEYKDYISEDLENPERDEVKLIKEEV